MQNSVEIKKLSREEKLRMMEAIWADLSNEAEMLDSPEWHGKALEETQSRLRAGQDKILDWQDAKKDLRKRFE